MPFLKVVNDTAVAVNQGGKRKGAVCSYLETWHLDIEEFLELRKNTGDDRRRTHDMNTANWIPDLFMKRVMEDGDWTLFSPSDVPDLHDKFGKAFEEALHATTKRKAARGELKLFKKIPAVQLWRKMLSMLFETGPSVDHVQGSRATSARRSSTSASCTARTCAPRSRSTPATTRSRCATWARSTCSRTSNGRPAELDHDKLQAHDPHRDAHARQRDRHQLLRGRQGAQFEPASTVRSASASWASRTACTCCACRTRSQAAVEFADRSMEAICYYAYWASTELAEERGRYSIVQGLAVGPRHPAAGHARSCLREERGGYVEVDTSSTLDWDALRDAHQAARHAQLQLHRDRADRDHLQHHRRVGRASSPTYQNLYVKSNLSGEFTVVNEYLVARPEGARPVGRGDGRRPQVLRRHARQDRPHSAGAAQAVRHGVRGRAEVAGRMRRRAARSGSTRRSR